MSVSLAFGFLGACRIASAGSAGQAVFADRLLVKS
jgi:hypothetical protein